MRWYHDIEIIECSRVSYLGMYERVSYHTVVFPTASLRPMILLYKLRGIHGLRHRKVSDATLHVENVHGDGGVHSRLIVPQRAIGV